MCISQIKWAYEGATLLKQNKEKKENEAKNIPVKSAEKPVESPESSKQVMYFSRF